MLHGGKSGLNDITDSQRIVMKCTDDLHGITVAQGVVSVGRNTGHNSVQW